MIPADKAKKTKILFYYLSAFSNTGGIERFNRSFIKALNDTKGINTTIVSVYDKESDARYNHTASFAGYHKKKLRSLIRCIRSAFAHDVLVLGHINLSVAAVFVKLLKPSVKIILIAHGKEIWPKASGLRKFILKKADTILAVSHYTRNQIVLNNGISPSRISLFPNTIDPFFTEPVKPAKPEYLLSRYHLRKDQPILLTLSRLQPTEEQKGYDVVLSALPAIIEKYPDLVYILAGKLEQTEAKRINDLIEMYAVKDHVILPGFIEDHELPDHYQLASLFIMPSRKEGFGIVFLEALVCGVDVMGGNQDGTVDALANGSFGTLVNPTKKQEIADKVIEVLSHPLNEAERFDRKKKVLRRFHFNDYKERLSKILFN